MFVFVTLFFWAIIVSKIRPCWENLSICICFLESQTRICLFGIKIRIGSQLYRKKVSNNVYYTLIKSYVDVASSKLLQEYLNFTLRMCHVFFLTNLNTLFTTKALFKFRPETFAPYRILCKKSRGLSRPCLL